MYYVSQSGAHCVKCDHEECKNEMIGPTEESVYTKCALAGWIETDGHMACRACQSGIAPTARRMKAAFGGANPVVEVPATVVAGDDFVDDNGEVVGKFVTGADAGGLAEVELDFSKFVTHGEEREDLALELLATSDEDASATPTPKPETKFRIVDADEVDRRELDELMAGFTFPKGDWS